MTDADKKLLIEWDEGTLSTTLLLSRFSVDLKSNPDYIRQEINAAMESANADELQLTIGLIWLSGNTASFTDLLNQLLIHPNHRSHQRVAKALQNMPDPATIPFVRKVLESNFDYLSYTYSDNAVIAKWFSWLLHSIGTAEAIDLIKEYSHSADEGISKEMQYRLAQPRRATL